MGTSILPQQVLRSLTPQKSSSPTLPEGFLPHAAEYILNHPAEPSAVEASGTLER